MDQSKPLILVDGSSYLYRAFYAIRELSTKDGFPTNAMYGVINMLKKLLADYDPTHMAVVFDAKGKTFRDDMYSEYKANRPPMPDDMRPQIEPLHKIIKAMGLPLLCVENVEADDVIGTLANEAAANGQEVVVSTGDKDMAQLVNDHVTLVNTMTETVMDIQGVMDKFGVPPNRIIDYLALVGDTSDNIPGVEKCGPKTAVKWLQAHESVAGVIDNADKIGGKVGENLRNGIEQLKVSYQLTTIKLDVELEQTYADLSIQTPDNETLLELYTRYQFNRWREEARQALGLNDSDLSPGEQAALAKLATGNAKKSAYATTTAGTTQVEIPAPPDNIEYHIIYTQSDFDDWLAKLNKADLIAFDLETDSLNYMQANIVGCSFAVKAGEAAYVPLAHDYIDAPTQLNREQILQQLKPLLEDAQQAKVGQHLKYDAHVLQRYDIHLQGYAHDTILESYVLNSTATRHDMDSLAKHYLDVKTIKFEEVAGKGKAQKTFNELGIEEAGHYAAEDADITLRLHQTLLPQLEANEPLLKVYRDIEMPLAPVIMDIEHTGVLIDADVLYQHSNELAQRLQESEIKAHEAAGQSFNLSSPKQLQEILFEKLGLPIIRKTPKGQPSTAEDVLEQLADEYELPRLIIDHRSLAKLKSTYTDKLPDQIDRDTGRIHTSYHQAVAATGRLSSSDPNLQNIPIRNAEGRRIRQAFIAPDNCILVAADYSQIELRIMAHLSGDETLVAAFANNEDIHSRTAAEIFELSLNDVQTEQRRAAKAINFGLIYGMSAFGLAKNLNIGRAEAAAYIETYFQRYPGVKRYMDSTRQQAHEDGFVETIFGRRLYLPEINAKNAQRRQYAERTAINAPMQGSAADIIKLAMIDVHNWLKTANNGTRIIMQVHDELVIETPADYLDSLKPELNKRMVNAAKLAVPLEVDIGVGNNWDEAH